MRNAADKNTRTIPSGFSLVEATSSDADDAFALTRKILKELADEGKESWFNLNVPEEVFREYFEADDCVVLAAEDDASRRVAYAAAHFREAKTSLFYDALRRLEKRDVEPRHVGYIFFIEVAEHARGRGLQRYFFYELEKRLQTLGARYLTGLVSPDNSPSLTNFRKSGFVEAGEMTLPSGFPRILMIKKLE